MVRHTISVLTGLTLLFSAGCTSSPVKIAPPRVAQGGRALSIAVVSNNDQRMVVATETGGLFRTFDWGRDARVEQGLLVTQSPTGRGRDLVEMLNSTGFRVDAISERRPSLEQIFLRLTQEASN